MRISFSVQTYWSSAQNKSVFCLLTLMGGGQSLDLLKQATVVHSCLTEHLSGGPMYYSSERVCSWISPCHGLFSLCPQWCADGLMMRQVSGRWRIHLVAADTCQKENLLMRREQLQSRCRLIKHCSLLASDWPAYDRGDGETALCLSLITRQDAEENKLIFLSNTDISLLMPVNVDILSVGCCYWHHSFLIQMMLRGKLHCISPFIL